MGAFFKTFFVCLVITFSFLVYKCFSTDGFSPDLVVSKNSQIFGIHKDKPLDDEVSEIENSVSNEQTEITDTEKTSEQPPEKIEKKYKHTCYFYSVKGELIPVTRELATKPSLESVILILLKGPMIPETKKGIYSEI